MFVLKNVFNRIFENKLAVVADYYEIKLIKDKQKRKEYDQSCQRIDPSAPNTGKKNTKNISENSKVYARIQLTNVFEFLPRVFGFQV